MTSRRRAACEHSHSVSTVFAGIRRSVCVDCGNVSVSHHHDLVVDGGNRLAVSHVAVGEAREA
ncbi:MAG: hypothetical protein R3258_02115 [Acidimicrobiia bacterium]|nr:hypothetical protein [Acidimicrobiia bacterium]